MNKKLNKTETLRETLDNHSDINYVDNLELGINEKIVKKISKTNKEPNWMLELRLKALDIFNKKDLPKWGPSLKKLDLQKICYFGQAEGSGAKNSWEDVPDDIKHTFDKLGIPEAEKKALAGVGAQYDSEVIYHSIKEEYSKLGVIFDDMSIALNKYEDIVKKYFSKCIPLSDHKFASLHYAVWSGGTFLYIPKGVKLSEPLQSYFRMNMQAGGQFEHTLIILEEGAEASYIEGCSAPKFNESSLHAGGVEIFVGKNAKMRYSSVENWSINTYNLNTKRAIVEKNGFIEWIGGNMGSGVTMLYPCSILKGDYSKANHLGIAFANKGQIQDTGSKIIHIGKNTTSEVLSKSISKSGGKSIYRGLLDIKKSATNSVSKIDCDALILDNKSVSDTIPDIRVMNASSMCAHEASAGKINPEDLFYLESRGINESDAGSMIVNGFVNNIIKELPLEYASEMNVLISMEMEGGVG